MNCGPGSTREITKARRSPLREDVAPGDAGADPADHLVAGVPAQGRVCGHGHAGRPYGRHLATGDLAAAVGPAQRLKTPSGGSGEATASASRTRPRRAREPVEVVAVDDPGGHGIPRAPAHEPLDRQLGVRGDGDQVAEAAAAQGAGLGEQADMAEHRPQGGDLRAGERQRRAVGDVRDVHAPGAEHAVGLRGELGAGEVGRCAGAGERRR